MSSPPHLKIVDASHRLAQPSLRVGERLRALDLITADQLHIALHEQKRENRLLGAILVELGFLDDRHLAQVLAEHSGYRRIDLKSVALDPVLVRSLPKTVALRCRAVPVRLDGHRLELAMADPYDVRAIDEIRRHLPADYELELRVAADSDITAALDQYGELATALDDILKELESGAEAKPARQAELQHPIVRLADTLLIDAVRQDASDIHLEPESNFIRIRYRIDGILRQTRALHRAHWSALSHRFKIMAGMNIADTRSMQDGRFQLEVGGMAVDFRMSVMPVLHGENIVIRILDHRRAHLPLDGLGMSLAAQNILSRILGRPEGIILVTGPTGSGKTTTLYSILHLISTAEVNIMTLEEPVEYQLSLIRQTSVQEKQGISFGAGVRGILRQDPDIIFIGEMRDSDTAQMALRAAMTGHQVFSTLHCNDAVGALPRLKDLGVSASMIAGNLSGIIAQRLVRKLCPHCKQPHIPTPDEQALIDRHSSARLLPSLSEPLTAGFAERQSAYDLGRDAEPVVYRAVGCEQCGQSGYRGRIAVAEILAVTPAFDALIAADAPRAELLRQARSDGIVAMAADGIGKIRQGLTSFDALRRVVDLTR